MKSAVLLAFAAATTVSTHAFAMPHCGEREAVVATLADQHAEQHIASGFQSDTGLMEIWASTVDGSWTILLTRPDGMTCVMATGTHWLTQEIMAKVVGEPV